MLDCYLQIMADLQGTASVGDADAAVPTTSPLGGPPSHCDGSGIAASGSSGSPEDCIAEGTLDDERDTPPVLASSAPEPQTLPPSTPLAGGAQQHPMQAAWDASQAAALPVLASPGMPLVACQQEVVSVNPALQHQQQHWHHSFGAGGASDQMLAIISAAATAATTAAASAMQHVWLPPGDVSRLQQQQQYNSACQQQQWRLGGFGAPSEEPPRRTSSPEPVPHALHARLVAHYPQPRPQQRWEGADVEAGPRIVRLADPKVVSRMVSSPHAAPMPTFQDFRQASTAAATAGAATPRPGHWHWQVDNADDSAAQQGQLQQDEGRAQKATFPPPAATPELLPAETTRSTAGTPTRSFEASLQTGHRTVAIPAVPAAAAIGRAPNGAGVPASHGIVAPRIHMPSSPPRQHQPFSVAANLMPPSAPSPAPPAIPPAMMARQPLPQELKASVSHVLEVLQNPDTTRGQRAAAYPPVMEDLERAAAERWAAVCVCCLLGSVILYNTKVLSR